MILNSEKTAVFRIMISRVVVGWERCSRMWLGGVQDNLAHCGKEIRTSRCTYFYLILLKCLFCDLYSKHIYWKCKHNIYWKELFWRPLLKLPERTMKKKRAWKADTFNFLNSGLIVYKLSNQGKLTILNLSFSSY